MSAVNCALPIVVMAVALSSSANSPGQPAKAAVAVVPPIVRALAFSRDGKTLVAGFGSKDEPGGVTAWDMATRKPIWHRAETGWVPSVSFASDGQSLAIAHGKPDALRLDPATGKELGVVAPHPADVRTLAFISGTDLLATGFDKVILLWDVKSGAIHRTLIGHTKDLRSLVASPDGRWLISTGLDGTRLWDVSDGKELKNAIGQVRAGAIYGITFIGADRLLFGNNDGTHKVVQLPGGKEVLRFGNAGGCDGAAYSSAAGLAAFHGGPFISIIDLTFRSPTPTERNRVEQLLKQFDDDSYEVREAASETMRAIGSVAEPLLRAAMTAGPTAEVRMRAREVRQTILDEPIRRLTGHIGDVGPMAFSPDGRLLASGGEDGTIRLWDPQTGRELARFDASRK